MSHETPFSFHCMICFEEFDPVHRYPVILPCGHTYVCSVCAERLDKCMECRTSLYYTVPRQPHTSPATARAWSSRRAVVDSSPQQQMVKKRLPLPKNVVLLSLIEATELASQHIRKGNDEPSPMREFSEQQDEDSVTASVGHWEAPKVNTAAGDIRSMGSMIDVDSDDDDDDDEEIKIRMGTSLAVGVAGTYAVAARDGLQIYPSTKPRENNNNWQDEDVDRLVQNFHLEHEHDHRDERASSNSSQQTGGSPRNPARLSYGDRVQIVALEGGWAKLARGYGYARAEHGSLVKVGNALDKACKLEALLRSLSSRRKALRQEQTQIDNRFIQTMNHLQISLENDEDLTVILADTFASVPNVESKNSIKEENDDEVEKEQRAPETLTDTISIEKARLRQQQNEPPRSPLTRFGCFPGDVFDTGVFDTEQSVVEETRTSMPDIPHSALYNALIPGSPSLEHRQIQASVTHPSPSAMREGARAWRERHRQQPRTGVDFRTGMSGHKALYSPQARHPHAFLETVSSWTGMKMSSHTGLSLTGSSRANRDGAVPPAAQTAASSSLLGSWMAPSILSSPPRDDEHMDQLPQGGSM